MKKTLKVALMLVIMFVLMAAFIPHNGTAVVDGDYSEWDLVDTYVGDMYRSNDPAKPIESKLYMMYNWGITTASFLVLTENDPLVYVDPPINEHWVKQDGKNGTRLEFLEFEYIYGGGELIGWEATIVVPCGYHPELYVHTFIDGEDQETSAIQVDMNVDCSLPVELTSFTATNLNGDIVLAWATASETENLGFIIERKESGGDWVEIVSFNTDSSLLGQGSTPFYTEYQYIDKDIVLGNKYGYRLIDVDYYGVMEYHYLIEVLAKYDYNAEANEHEEQTNFGLFRGCS